jgi:lipopolysaccharide export LptBFGC system permease protein LptF
MHTNGTTNNELPIQNEKKQIPIKYTGQHVSSRMQPLIQEINTKKQSHLAHTPSETHTPKSSNSSSTNSSKPNQEKSPKNLKPKYATDRTEVPDILKIIQPMSQSAQQKQNHILELHPLQLKQRL